jgi:hypothetical protein
MIAMINEVSPLWSKEFGPTHQNIAVLLQHRGEAYAKKNQPDRAEADLRQALALRLKYLPAKHPVIATTQPRQRAGGREQVSRGRAAPAERLRYSR